ncbi:MAG TPA: hypothetical protein VF607_11550, partial [Verrucomicrobiae bacterium]
SQLTLTTLPASLPLLWDGQPINTTTSLVAVVGMSHLLGAPATQTWAGTNYPFVVWSDGGNASHYVTAAITNSSFTASYQTPILSLGNAPDGSLQLSWPAWAGGMKLLVTTNLADPAGWMPQAISPLSSNGNQIVNLPAGSGNQFYRLQWP